MAILFRLLVNDRALTWAHRCIAWRQEHGRFYFMYVGGLDKGYIEKV